jgi:hypothetical protein
MSERWKQDTQLTALEGKVVGQRLRVEKLRDALRDILDPVKKPEDLDRDTAFELMMQFTEAHLLLSETVATIAKLKELLGR